MPINLTKNALEVADRTRGQENIERLLLRAIDNMDAKAVRIAAAALPGGLAAHSSVARTGLALSAAVTRKLESLPERLRIDDYFIGATGLFFSDLERFGDVDFLRRDNDGTTVIHHMMKHIVVDCMAEGGGGCAHLSRIFSSSVDNPLIHEALFSKDNDYKQDALTFALSQSLCRELNPRGVGPKFVSAMKDIYCADNDRQAPFSPRDEQGISLFEYLALIQYGGARAFILGDGNPNSISLGNIAWLISYKKSVSDAFFENFKALVECGVSCSAGPDGLLAGDDLFDSAISQARTVNNMSANSRGDSYGADVIDFDSFFTYEESCLADVTNCLLFLMAERPDLCPKAFALDRKELYLHLESIRHYANQTQSEHERIVGTLFSSDFSDFKSSGIDSPSGMTF